MKTTQRFISAIVLVLVLVVVLDASAAESEWVSLFDGETLDGWKQVIEPCRPDNRPEEVKKSKPVPAHLRQEDQRGKASFRVENGAIVGRAEDYSIHSYLCTEKEYGDFELEFEVFVGWPETQTGGCNSGIQIRSKWDPEEETHRMHGLQIDIDERPGFAGWLFVEGIELRKMAKGKIPHPKNNPNPHTFFKAGEWNRMRIRAVGPKIQTWVNDQPVADFNLPELYEAQPQGFIGLQVHEILNPRPAELRWRNIRLRECAVEE